MAKRQATEDEIVDFAFYLACEGLQDEPYRMFPPEIWTREQIYRCLSGQFGSKAAKWAMSMRLFTEH